ncbi:unnamed protein product, partial [Medioppia subpectinata]
LFIWGLGPAYVPYWLWSESLWCSWFVAVMLRYCISLHTSFLINSAAHMYGMKPYDNTLIPVEANVRHFLVGEGFHNYHHSFPQDYSASELGAIDSFNPQTAFIDMFAAIGWAYDLKKPSIDAVKNRRIRCGDNSNQISRSRLSEQIVGLLTVFMPFWVITILRMNAFVWPVIPMGLYLITCHPHGFNTNKVIKSKTVDVSNLLADPVVSFQHKHYFVLGLFIWGLGPAYVTYWLWSESLWCSWFVAVMLRYVISLHTSFLINSAAHMYGMKVFMHVN